MSGLFIAAIGGITYMAVMKNSDYRVMHQSFFNIATIIFIAYFAFWLGYGYAMNSVGQSEMVTSKPVAYGLFSWLVFVAYIAFIDHIGGEIDRRRSSRK